MLGALVLAAVSGFIERASAHLAGGGERRTEVDRAAGVRRAAPEALEATSGRAAVILLLAASRFWLALLLLVVALVTVNEHRASLLGGFVAAVLFDSLYRLKAGLAGPSR